MITIEDIAGRWAVCYECSGEQVMAAVHKHASQHNRSITNVDEFIEEADKLFLEM